MNHIATHSRRPRLLDLFCCQGGASAGYAAAGFDVVGVDIDPQPRYPFPFVQADAIEFVREHGHEFDAIHASPPCQGSSATHRLWRREWPHLIAPTREALQEVGVPWVIENVMDAEPELIDPVMLCGAMFGLRTYRHRLFETSWNLVAPDHPKHVARQAKMGRPVRDGEFIHMVGNFSGVELARQIINAPWMNRDGLRESIPPAYAEWVGLNLRAAEMVEVAA